VAEYTQLGTALSSNTVQNDIFLFLAVTGWRSNEARCLRHSEIDIERRIVTLADTKSGVSIHPLSQAALDIVRRQVSATNEYVFVLQHGKLVSN
jgi:integrase